MNMTERLESLGLRIADLDGKLDAQLSARRRRMSIDPDLARRAEAVYGNPGQPSSEGAADGNDDDDDSGSDLDRRAAAVYGTKPQPREG